MASLKTDALIMPLLPDKILAEEKELDRLLNRQISKLRQSKDFTGEPNKARILFSSGNLPRIILVGLGPSAGLNSEKLREAMSTATTELKKLPLRTMTALVPKLPGISPAAVTQALTEGVLLSHYEFPYYKTAKNNPPKPDSVEFVSLRKAELRLATVGFETGLKLGQIVNAVRDLGNQPANIATPTHLANYAEGLARTHKNIKVKILHKADIKKENMGAILAVSQGSDEEPKFIVLEYRGKTTGAPVVLVGKGITFDSGGISIKPGEKMEEMKYDMAGAATVMGVIQAASELKLLQNLVGLIPATENLPSGKAAKPGDIIRSRSGKTIEIINTDAEGRLVLSDALDYAKKYKPRLVIDFATLTGSIVVALGDELTGVFTNTKRFLDNLEAAAKLTGEKIWPMPLEKSYQQFIKSDFADLRNLGTVRYGDSINAALFLEHFVDYPWIHLDIAGVAWATREKPYRPKGATGTGLRLIVEFLKNLKS